MQSGTFYKEDFPAPPPNQDNQQPKSDPPAAPSFYQDDRDPHVQDYRDPRTKFGVVQTNQKC